MFSMLQMSYLFKVWSANRKQKTSFLINKSVNILSDLITKTNTKLGINGSIFVMEKDGTNVDDDEVLKFCSGEIFMLLEEKDIWSPQNETESQSHTATSCDNDSTSIFSSSSSMRYALSPTPLLQSDNDEIWMNFCIPWDKLESAVVKELEASNRSKYIIHAVVNRIISEMKNENLYLQKR
ncbi:uncharacterized protein LOC118646197 [Monomorium pharaonis]|uniref:uncharacterized protein LOC118646197 n=1 Tax=Monomorium pharaonis TaxID=307658 RepID=UPI001746B442|nr:uncharacterized protein LOC118646197 [Monomorium pharaonis]